MRQGRRGGEVRTCCHTTLLTKVRRTTLAVEASAAPLMKMTPPVLIVHVLPLASHTEPLPGVMILPFTDAGEHVVGLVVGLVVGGGMGLVDWGPTHFPPV